jgi:hypothetical protein
MMVHIIWHHQWAQQSRAGLSKVANCGRLLRPYVTMLLAMVQIVWHHRWAQALEYINSVA